MTLIIKVGALVFFVGLLSKLITYRILLKDTCISCGKNLDGKGLNKFKNGYVCLDCWSNFMKL